MMDDEEAIRQARAIQQELSQHGAAFDKVRADLMEAWKNTAITESDLRERLFLSVWTLDAVRKQLLSGIDSGVIAMKVVESLRAA